MFLLTHTYIKLNKIDKPITILFKAAKANCTKWWTSVAAAPSSLRLWTNIIFVKGPATRGVG